MTSEIVVTDRATDATVLAVGIASALMRGIYSFACGTGRRGMPCSLSILNGCRRNATQMAMTSFRRSSAVSVLYTILHNHSLNRYYF